MNRGFGVALVLGSCLMTAPRMVAQTPTDAGAGRAGQSQTDGNAKKSANGQSQSGGPQSGGQASPQTGANPFPGDTSNVPVMPSNLTPDLPPGTFGDADSAAASLPGDDMDPVRSPDETGAGGGSVQEMDSSSDVKSMDSLLPGPGDDETGKRKKGGVIAEAPKETSKEDISVGKYYLDQKNWKAALSRFQSALVLAPEDPEVYWGLAESARHLGKFADAKANYQKVMEYDPGSKHAKDAEKALKDPEIENAKAQ